MSSTPALRSLNINNINQHVVAAKYAVRGELAVKSEEYRAQFAKGAGQDLPFDAVISADIGNPQQLDQKPITFFRQVLSLLEYPTLLESEDVLLNQLGYKTDVIARAKWLLKSVGSVGAYSASAGVPAIKESVAKFIESKFYDIYQIGRLLTCFQEGMASHLTLRISIFREVLPLESTLSYTSSVHRTKRVFSFQFLNTHSTPLPLPFSTRYAFHTI